MVRDDVYKVRVARKVVEWIQHVLTQTGSEECLSCQLRLCSHMLLSFPTSINWHPLSIPNLQPKTFHIKSFNKRAKRVQIIHQKASTFQVLSSFTSPSSNVFSIAYTLTHSSLKLHVFRLNTPPTSSTTPRFKPRRIRCNDLEGGCCKRGKCSRVGRVQNSNFIQ